MCTLHRVSFLDRAGLIDGLQALISKAKSPELREFHVFELGGSELPWKDLGYRRRPAGDGAGARRISGPAWRARGFECTSEALRCL